LSQAGINIVAIAQGSSELNISFVVAAKDTAAAQRAIHAAFQLAKLGGGSAAEAEHTDVVMCGFGQIGRELASMIAKASNGVSGRHGKPGGKAPRVVAVMDRSGFLFEPAGFSARAVAGLVAWKKEGKPF